MSRQKAGLKKEHELAQAIANATDRRVLPLRAGWSGNSAIPSPDLLIPLNGYLRAVELKTSGQRRLTVTPEDVEEILWWQQNQKEVPTVADLCVKFTHYEAYVDSLVGADESIERAFENWAESAPFDTNVTKSGNLTIGHPTHYDVEHTSARASDGDGLAVLRQLNEKQQSDLVSVTDVLERINET